MRLDSCHHALFAVLTGMDSHVHQVDELLCHERVTVRDAPCLVSHAKNTCANTLVQNSGAELVQNSCMHGARLSLPGVFKYQSTSLEFTE